jgi:N utilization substance protein A
MKLTSDEIFFLNELHNISSVHAKDCLISNDVVSFIVKRDDLGKAIGKNAQNIKTMTQKTKKRIEILEYCDKVSPFVEKSLYKVKPDTITEIEEEGKRKVLIHLNSENRKKMMNNLGRLKRIKELAKRNYKVDDIKIK